MLPSLQLVFSGLKLAYKAFKAYSNVKEELAEFEEDFDELNMRLMAMDPIMQALEGRLNDNLTMVLTIAKTEQEKANAYTDQLFAYCRKFKESGSQFKAIATALASKAVDSLPSGLREGAQALMPIVAKHGVPEKAYAKFADKLHFLMSSLSAAAAAQALQGGAPSQQTAAARPAVTAIQHTPSGNLDDSKAPEVLTVAEQQQKLNDIVNEMVEEDNEDFKAILLGVFRLSKTFVFAVWVEKVPHLMFVQYAQCSMPQLIRIMRAPSTKFLVDLSQNGLPPRTCFKTAIQVVVDKCKREAAAELRINQFTYWRRYNRQVVNKWLYVPYAPLCCACLFHRLQIRDFKLDSKEYNIMIEHSTELSVNGNLLLDTKTLGYGGCCM